MAQAHVKVEANDGKNAKESNSPMDVIGHQICGRGLDHGMG